MIRYEICYRASSSDDGCIILETCERRARRKARAMLTDGFLGQARAQVVFVPPKGVMGMKVPLVTYVLGADGKVRVRG